MRVINDISQYTPQRGLCLTIGNFDGLHLGHRSLINRAKEVAKEHSLDFAVMTFWPHPRTIVKASAPHFPLTDRSERLRLMEAAGVPLVFELTFDERMANLSAGAFVEQTLLPLSLSWLVIGYDFSMGHNREGGAQKLRDLGMSHSFKVEQIPPFEINGAPVSSSALRKALAEGDMVTANTMLGRDYSLNGKIVHGDARGRVMGFPTANLGEIKSLLPGHGIYATLAHINGEVLPAATSVGTNPTFDGRKTTVESFLLEGGDDLYDKEMRLEFVEKIRNQHKFDSAEELARQIGRDVQKVKAILSPNKP